MTKIGYARVSTDDQHLDAQTDRLTAAGCERIFADTASGTLAKRPQLDKALDYLRHGDTLVITRMDRLGRSMRHLMDLVSDLDERGIEMQVLEQGIDTSTPTGVLFFHIVASIAEFERALLVERTHEGLAAARARGRKGGRRPVMTADKARIAREMYDSKQYTIDAIAKTIGVSRATVYRHLGAAQTESDRVKRAASIAAAFVVLVAALGYSSVVDPEPAPETVGMPASEVVLESGSFAPSGGGEPISHEDGQPLPAWNAIQDARTLPLAGMEQPDRPALPITDEYLVTGIVTTTASGGEPLAETGYAWSGWNAPHVAERLARYYIQPQHGTERA